MQVRSLTSSKTVLQPFLSMLAVAPQTRAAASSHAPTILALKLFTNASSPPFLSEGCRWDKMGLTMTQS